MESLQSLFGKPRNRTLYNGEQEHMRKLAYFAAVALLCTGIAVAQDQTQQNPSSSPSAQQPSNSNPSGNAADQNQATPSSTDQNQATPAQSSDQNAQTGAAAGHTGNAHAGKKLPQTASPLPLLSLLGMGLIGAGTFKNRVSGFFKK